jgi:hypothetical protein
VSSRAPPVILSAAKDLNLPSSPPLEIPRCAQDDPPAADHGTNRLHGQAARVVQSAAGGLGHPLDPVGKEFKRLVDLTGVVFHPVVALSCADRIKTGTGIDEVGVLFVNRVIPTIITDGNVVSSATPYRVIPLATNQRVVAVCSNKNIATSPATDRVGMRTSMQPIIPATAIQRVTVAMPS